MLKKALEWTKNAFSFLKSHLSTKAVAIILSSAVGVAGLAAGGVTLAKYAIEHNNDKVVSTKDFYFESNLLKPVSENAIYHNGTNSISFDLMNFVDELRESEVNITYQVSITKEDLSPADGAQGTNTSGTLYNTSRSTTTVTYTNLEYGVAYIVTASSTAPYTKTLRATFQIPEKDDAVTWTVNDSTDFVTITAITNNFAGNVTLSWQNGYVPDNSYAPLMNATTSPFVVTLESKSTYVFRFFKSDLNAEYTEASFKLTN